jgi:hypothetical protein
LQFKNKVLSLPQINTSYHKQPCETWQILIKNEKLIIKYILLWTQQLKD